MARQKKGPAGLGFYLLSQAALTQSPATVLRPPPLPSFLLPLCVLFLLLLPTCSLAHSLALVVPTETRPSLSAELTDWMLPMVETQLHPWMAKLPSHSLGSVFCQIFPMSVMSTCSALCWGWQEEFSLVPEHFSFVVMGDQSLGMKLTGERNERPWLLNVRITLPRPHQHIPCVYRPSRP